MIVEKGYEKHCWIMEHGCAIIELKAVWLMGYDQYARE